MHEHTHAFLPIFTKGNDFLTSFLLPCATKLFQKTGSTLQEKKFQEEQILYFTTKESKMKNDLSLDVCPDAVILTIFAWPRGYKTFSMLNSAEHEILPAHKY